MASCGRAFSLTIGRPFSLFVWCLYAGFSSARHFPPGTLSGRKLIIEKSWRAFFSDPSQWLDNRLEKLNSRYPDFKHKKTQQPLWVDNNLNPPWVEAELAALAPGTVQINIFSWNTKLRSHVKAGHYTKTVELFQRMQGEGIETDKFTFPPVLNACSSLRSLEEGRRVHEQIIQRGFDSDVYVGSCLVDMYAKCGSIDDAWSVFNKMPEHDVVTWTAMISGYVKSGQGLKAMGLFQEMQQEGVQPDTVTFVGVLNACATVAALEEGRRVHQQIVRSGCEADIYVGSCLVDMYAKCGSTEEAWSVFSKICKQDVVAWNAMIGGYVKSGQGLKAIELFRKMQQKGVEPDDITFVGVLNACASVNAIEEGKRIHEQIIGRGCESDGYVGNCLVDMYAKCGSIEDGWRVFNKLCKHDVVTWNVIIGGYVKSGQGLKAMELFQSMQQEGVEPDAVTFVGVLNACASVMALEYGRHVHEQIIQKDFESDVYVGSCLVDMYAKCGRIEDAWSVFNKLREHDMVTWSAMIGGYAKSGNGLKAMELFRRMQHEGVEPDAVTFVGVLNACASVVAFEEGRSVHEQIIRRGWESEVYIGGCLVDMYAKCGSIEDARKVFDKMSTRDVAAWNAMIGGYAMHGNAEKAIGLFERMGKEGIEIDGITFTCLLSACSHGGLVKEGLRYFESMSSCANVLPTKEHLVCMVDLLGRAGMLGEAEELTNRMPMETAACMLMSLLGACRVHGNIEIAERAAKRCWELDSENDSAQVLMSQIYAAAGMWDRCAAIEEERLERKVWIEPGRSWMEVEKVVHSFVVDDEGHPQILEIRAELQKLLMQMSEARHMADSRLCCIKKRNALNCVATVRSLPLHVGLSKHLRVPHCLSSKSAGFLTVAIIPSSS